MSLGRGVESAGRVRHARRFVENGARQLCAPMCGARSLKTIDDERVTCIRCMRLLAKRQAKASA